MAAGKRKRERKKRAEGGEARMAPEVSRLVTLVTEHRLAEKKEKNSGPMLGHRENLSVSPPFCS
jgi:phosphatidate phosphatase PAH1